VSWAGRKTIAIFLMRFTSRTISSSRNYSAMIHTMHGLLQSDPWTIIMV
jgi:hypothetical protein